MRPARNNLIWLGICLTACLMPAVGRSQSDTRKAAPNGIPTDQILSQRIGIDLRDATLLEALFAIRDVTGLNMVVGNEVTGTVNAAFTDTPVEQVLDSLLIPRGYGYRIVSGSLAILPLESVGDRLPNFETVVVRLQANSPEDVLAGVESLLSPEGRIHAIPSSNSLLIMDYAERIAEARRQLEALEQAALEHSADARQKQADASESLPSPAVVDQVVRVFRPQFVTATSLSEGIRPLLSTTGQLSAMDAEDKLIVTDTADAVERVAQALSELDAPRPQVRIWALIYDCSLEDLDACGINFRTGVNGTEVNSNTGDPNHLLLLDSVTASVAAPTNGVMTLSTIHRLGTVRGIIQALESGDDTRLLADPNVVVMNHEAANIEIVTEVPYQQLTQGIQGGTIGTTSFREAGVQMTVTPHIAQDNTIAMQINPRFSLLTGFTETDNAPIIDRRETQTTVRIENLQTLVLGGLRQRTRTVQQNAIPGLSKIPYLGHLFRYKQNAARESELIVFITPEIIAPHECGTGREMCVLEQLNSEVEQAPTIPRPFGIETLRAEEKAEKRYINTWKKHHHDKAHPGGNCPGCSQCKPARYGRASMAELSTTVDPRDAPTIKVAIPTTLVSTPTTPAAGSSLTPGIAFPSANSPGTGLIGGSGVEPR